MIAKLDECQVSSVTILPYRRLPMSQEIDALNYAKKFLFCPIKDKEDDDRFALSYALSNDAFLVTNDKLRGHRRDNNTENFIRTKVVSYIFDNYGVPYARKPWVSFKKTVTRSVS